MCQIADQEKRGKAVKEEQKKIKDSLTTASKQVSQKYRNIILIIIIVENISIAAIDSNCINILFSIFR